VSHRRVVILQTHARAVVGMGAVVVLVRTGVSGDMVVYCARCSPAGYPVGLAASPWQLFSSKQPLAPRFDGERRTWKLRGHRASL